MTSGLVKHVLRVLPKGIMLGHDGLVVPLRDLYVHARLGGKIDFVCHCFLSGVLVYDVLEALKH